MREPKRAAFYERYLLRHTFAVSTMGMLERVGLPQQSGALTIEEAFLTGGGSIATSLMVASAEFRGRLCVSLQWIEPLVSERVIPYKRVRVQTLREHARRILTTQSYRDAAVTLGRRIVGTGGVRAAADVIERVVVREPSRGCASMRR